MSAWVKRAWLKRAVEGRVRPGDLLVLSSDGKSVRKHTEEIMDKQFEERLRDAGLRTYPDMEKQLDALRHAPSDIKLHDATTSVAGARIVQVIESDLRVMGTGVTGDPLRRTKEFFTFDGEKVGQGRDAYAHFKCQENLRSAQSGFEALRKELADLKADMILLNRQFEDLLAFPLKDGMMNPKLTRRADVKKWRAAVERELLNAKVPF